MSASKHLLGISGHLDVVVGSLRCLPSTGNWTKMELEQRTGNKPLRDSYTFMA